MGTDLPEYKGVRNMDREQQINDLASEIEKA